MWEEADMQERNTAVFSASALFEKRGFALLCKRGRKTIQALAIVGATIVDELPFPLRGCPARQCLPILLEFHQRYSIPARGSYQINRGQDKLSYPGIAWEMGHQFIPALCSFQNGLSLSIEAQYFGCSMKSAKHERNPPVFSEMGRGLVAAPGYIQVGDLMR
jgi:hypothetical protein